MTIENNNKQPQNRTLYMHSQPAHVADRLGPHSQPLLRAGSLLFEHLKVVELPARTLPEITVIPDEHGWFAVLELFKHLLGEGDREAFGSRDLHARVATDFFHSCHSICEGGARKQGAPQTLCERLLAVVRHV